MMKESIQKNMPGSLNMLEWALFYAGIGIPVFPIVAKTKDNYFPDRDHPGAPTKKYPYGNPYSWKAQATTDTDRIKKAWTEHPDANIGGATGFGLYVVDLDERENGSGSESIKKWESEGILPEKLPHTWKSITGSGSSQLFYYLEDRLEKIAKEKGINLSGDAAMVEKNSHVDTRGTGRYAILPPSIHPNGNRYQWDENSNPSTMNIAPMNKGVEYLFTHKSKKRRTKAERVNKESGELIPKGSRRSYLLQKAGELTNKLVDIADDSAIVSALMDIAHTDLDLSEPLDSGWDGLKTDMEKVVYDMRSAIEKEREGEQDPNYWTYNMRAWHLEHPNEEFDGNWDEVKGSGERRRKNELQIPEKADKVEHLETKTKLDQFHRFGKADKQGNRHPIDIIDVNICRYISETNHIIVVAGQPYLYQDGAYKIDQDGLKIKQMIKELIYPELIKNQRIEGCYKLLINDPVLHYEPSEVNRYPVTWINCKNGMLDAKEMKMYEHSPEYLSVNQVTLPWNPLPVDEEGISYQFMKSLIPDDEDLEMKLQFDGYCLTHDTSQQKALIETGRGGTGKSTTIKMLCNLIGSDNVSGLSLQDINKRFYPACLMGKLLNACADIPSQKMEVVDVIKKIIGEDTIMGEYKGGAVFWFRSYAKLLFSANTIPKVYDDKTDAFYRRLMILKIDKRAKNFDNLEDRLFEDRENYFRMIVYALNRMYQTGRIAESQNSKAAVQDLYAGSDTVYAFIESHTERDSDEKVSRKQIFELYKDYCDSEGRTPLTAFKFRENMENKGYVFCKIDGYDYVKGIRIKELI